MAADDRPTIVASVSGGKDSTALCLHLRELGLPYRAVFADTGWESAATYRYVREQLPDIVGPVEWVRAEVDLPEDAVEQAEELEALLGHPSPFVRLCLVKAMFPSRQIRWCTEQLKVVPLLAYMRAIPGQVVNATGIRRGESRARSRTPEWEHDRYADLLQWRPLVEWTEQDVIDIHHRHGVRPNPLYLDGASRVGCWPCIYARKSEIRNIADSDPTRIEVIRRLEAFVAERVRARPQRSETRRAAPSLFAARIGREGTWPIDKVVAWSRTSRGGRQVELFAPDAGDVGCLRWGFCDAPGGAL